VEKHWMREGQVFCEDCQTGHTPSLVNGSVAVACDWQLPDQGRAKAVAAGAAVTGAATPIPVDQVAVAVDKLGDRIAVQLAEKMGANIGDVFAAALEKALAGKGAA
jgi:hypothetical protein